MRIFLLLLILPFIHCTCRSGFELVRKGQCIGLYATLKVADNTAGNLATNKCHEIQALPVIIHDEDDNSYWKSRISSGVYLLLGLVCNSISKRWEWADGSAVDYKPASYSSVLDTNACVTGCVWEMSGDSWSNSCSTPEYTDNIFCTIQYQQPDPSADGCENFEDDDEDGVCYQVGATAENFQDAQNVCRSFGADLASVHNLKENSFIRRLAVSKGSITGLYLGATVSGKGNDFGWIDGSEWDYEYFFAGFPIPGLGDCIVMDTEGGTGQWVNVDCSSKQSVACVRKQHVSTSSCYPGPWKEGQIMYSPGFPYDASTPCDYMLTVDAGKKVQVEILLLEANTCCDHLVLLENYVGGTVVANLTGEVSQKNYTTSSSNFMRVSWLPNGGVNVRGMMFIFRGV